MGTYSWINSDISITMICELYVNNSGYGAISQSGFLFFDNRIAEGITMTGQFIIQYVSRHFNKRLNDFFKTKNKDYVFYMDTDSSFITLDDVVKKYYSDKSDEEIVSALDKLTEKHLRPLIDEATDHISKVQNYYKKTIYFKREKIFSSGLICVHPETKIKTILGDLSIEDLYKSKKEYSSCIKIDGETEIFNYDIVSKKIKTDVIDYVMRKSYSGFMYSFTYDNKTVRVTENHLILVDRGKKILVWVPAKEVMISDILVSINISETGDNLWKTYY
jgi:DNA polymerase elongation subunit (family B)